MKVVTLSPKGQITIPKVYRAKIKVKQYLFQMKGNSIILYPVKIEILQPQKKGVELENFGSLSESSFKDVWDNEEDNVYQKFYEKT